MGRVRDHSRVMERVEANSTGRAVISALVVLIVASVVMTSVNDSPLRRSLLSRDQALLDATGLDQRWNLFAPDPRRRSLDVRAVIHYVDGGRGTWTLPRRGRLVGVDSDHRWRKWMENGARGRPQSPLWPWLRRWLLAGTRPEGGPAIAAMAVARALARGEDPVGGAAGRQREHRRPLAGAAAARRCPTTRQRLARARRLPGRGAMIATAVGAWNRFWFAPQETST